MKTENHLNDNKTKKDVRNNFQSKRQMTTAFDQRNHWWKVCWFYDNKNVLFNTLGQKYSANTLPSRRFSSIQKKQQQPQEETKKCLQKSSMDDDFPQLSSMFENHMSLEEIQNGTNNHNHDNIVEPNQVNHILTNDSNNKIQMKMFYPNYHHHHQQQQQQRSSSFHQQTKSLDDMSLPSVTNREYKSMTNNININGNIDTSLLTATTHNARQQGLFTLPRLLENNVVQKEMARFYNQQFYVTQLIQTKIAQPLASWSKTKIIDSSQNRIVNFLTDYKGSVWREKQLELQMPNQDEQLFQQSTAESKFIRNKRRKALIRAELFLLSERKESCQKCKSEIQMQIHCVKITIPQWIMNTNPNNNNNSDSSNKNENSNSNLSQRYFHIDCFVCAECSEILVDLKAYINIWCDRQRSLINNNNNETLPFNLYCSRHFVEIYKPRCPFCDKLIFDEECTEAEGKAWHIGHFCCTECKRSLGGQQYIMAGANNNKKNDDNNDNQNTANDKQMPYCLTCFDIIFGDLCEECGLLIGCEVGAIVHEGRSWHANERCFRCSLCLKSLLGKPFLPALDGRIYCSIACSQAMIAHRKKSLKKQNKLQTLHSNHQIDHQKIVAEQQKMIDYENFVKNVQVKDAFNEQNSDNFIKLIQHHHQQPNHTQSTVGFRAKDNSNNGQEKPKEFNLSQVVDYVEFIKKNNQCFTSKYDWSKEQEFLSIVDSGNDVSSQTASTTSELLTEENSSIQPFTQPYQCDIDSGTSNKIDINRWQFPIKNSSNQKIDSNKVNNSFDFNLSLTSNDSQSSQQNDSINRSNNLIQSNHYSNLIVADIKLNSSLNSPTSSYEQTQTSPPPEYANIDMNVEENSSNSSSFQNLRPIWLQKNNVNNQFSKINIDSIPEIEQNNEQNPSISSKDSSEKVISNNKIDQQKTLRQEFGKNTASTNCNLSKSKSVSFDPNIKDTIETRKKSVRRIRYRPLANGSGGDYDDHDCSDSQSCSSCSTCSTSSDDDDDDDFEYDQEFFNNLNRKVEKRISNQNNNANNNNNNNANNQINNNNESCIIS